MAHRAVLRSFENELDQDTSKTRCSGRLKVFDTKHVKPAIGAGNATQNKVHQRNAIMRRTGRTQSTIYYREDSDPIESGSSSGEDMQTDQAPARRQPSRRRQQKQQLQFDVDFAAADAADVKRQWPRPADTGIASGAAADSEGIQNSDVDAGTPESDNTDSDFQQPAQAAKSRTRTVETRQAAGRVRKAAIGSSEDEAASDSEQQQDSDAEDSVEDEDSTEEEAEQQQQRRTTRHAAAPVAPAAGTARVTRRQQQLEEQRQAPRRSGRVAAASVEPEVVARPRRAAAAAATAATAAALQSERDQQRFGSSSPDIDDNDSDGDLGSRGGSDDEDEIMPLNDTSSEEDGNDVDSNNDSSDVQIDEDADCSSGGTSEKQCTATGKAVLPRTRRGRAGSRGSSEHDAGIDEQQYSEPEDDDVELPDLNAFRFDSSKGAAAAAAHKDKAAAAAKGSRRIRNSTGSARSSPAAASGDDAADAAEATGRRSGRTSPRAGGASPMSKAAAAREAAEAEAGHVLDPSCFAPVDVAKLSRKDDVEKILSVRYEQDGAMQVLVKLVGKSYRDAVWVADKQVQAKGRQQLLRNFLAKVATEGESEVPIDPKWYQVERVLEQWNEKKGMTYLVKWCGLEYVDSTWEEEEQVTRDGMGRAALARFKLWVKPPAAPPRSPKRPSADLIKQHLLPDFRNGRKLRDYQETSLHWMINNYRGEIRNGRWWPRNCILGDEMGLGKTAQSISVLAWLRQHGGVTLPFMVVAPLTTLHHWKREIETWTGMNAVLYTGSARDRQLIRETEFYYPTDRTARKVLGVRFDVLLTSYETVLKDRGEVKKISYEALVLDEAHRLKTRTSSTRAALLELPVHWWLLLSGTPVQNNMRELQGLMSVLDEEAYGDLDTFLERFGDTKPTIDQIRDLQAALAPVLLRRMKEDVENLPEKEEVVIWVELTPEQRRYYRALYSKQIGSLLQGVASKNLPGMRNLAMELRKLCCHPFLCDGLEEDMTARWAAAQAAGASGAASQEVEALTRASGKMLLLHKLLPKLRAEGRQVLIFSQFKMMLDVIEDFLAACKYPCERIDGDTNHKDRQAAIDRFMAAKDRKSGSSRSSTPAAAAADSSGSGVAAGQSGHEASVQQQAAAAVDKDAPFVFLLSTRAGGQGITLTSADTVIIYDSDWNPQNDLQAMARCHRIGQEREVTVYRLVSKDTYEQHLFQTASRKYGLDEAILGFAGTGDNPENDAARIEQLLRLGAHAIAGGDEPTAVGAEQDEDKGMAAEGIDQILAGRSEKRQLGSRKGNTFSIATFAAAGAEQELPELEEQQQPVDAKAFWSELLPEAVAAHAAALAAAKEPEVLGRRRRTVVNYREKGYSRFDSDSDDEDGKEAKRPAKRVASDEADDFDATKEEVQQDDDLIQHAKKKQKSKAAADTGPVHDPDLGRLVQPWTYSQCEVTFNEMLRYGPDRIDVIQRSIEKAGMSRSADEIQQLAKALEQLAVELDKLPETKPAPKPAAPSGVDAAGATAAAAAEEAAAKSKSHGTVKAEVITVIRDKLQQSGAADKLPPACRKALLSSSILQRLGRNPGTWLQQLREHQQVHQRMLAAGHAPKGSKATPATVAAAGSTPSKPGADNAAVAGTPSRSAAAGLIMQSPSKRKFVVPRVALKGFRQLPAWWSRDHDERLMLGCYNHGYSNHGKMNTIVEDILNDPVYGFTHEVAVDPVAAVQAAALAAAPLAGQYQQADAAAGSTAAPAPASVVPPEQLAQARAKKLSMLAAARTPSGVQWIQPADWKKFVTCVVARLKKVRACMLDPNYIEPPKGLTPCKPQVQQQPQLNLSKTPASMGQQASASTAAAAAVRAPGAQVKLNFTKEESKAAAPKDDAGAASVAAQKAIQQHCVKLQQQLAAKAAGNAGAAAAVPAARSGQGVKRLSPDVVIVDSDSEDFQPRSKQKVATDRAAVLVAGVRKPNAAAAAAPQQTAEAWAEGRQAVSSNSDNDDIVDLVVQDDSPPQKQAAAKPAVVAASKQQPQQPSAAAAVPSSGLVVKHVNNAELLSQDRSMEVDEPESTADDPSGTPASASKLHSTGRQQMQHLLGSSEGPADSTAAGAAGTPGQPHPVYGTPASDAAAAAASKRNAGSKSAKGKDDGKQRKITDMFGKKP